MPDHHTILGGKVHVYKRPNSSCWQSSSYLGGKNRRTSVEMIEKYYAAHIKTQLAAAAINIMRPKPKKKKKPAENLNQN